MTKKERRALKVKAKQAEAVTNNDVQVADKSNKNVCHVKATIPNQPKQETPPQQQQAAPEKVLSEKEKRKLEWEKKLSEQNIGNKEKDGLSKAELKNKRREQQEAQRQAKAKQQEEQKVKTGQKNQEVAKPKTETKFEKAKSPAEKPIKKVVKKPVQNKKVQLVQHLYNEDSLKSEYGNLLVNYKNVHPAFVRLGKNC